jgi:hypothetical protein
MQAGSAAELSNKAAVAKKRYQRSSERKGGDLEGVEENEAESVRQYTMAHKEDGGSVHFARVSSETINNRLNC